MRARPLFSLFRELYNSQEVAKSDVNATIGEVMKKKTKETTPQFLPQTESLGITEPRIRGVADALYLQYLHQSTMVFNQEQEEMNQLTYMQVLGAIRALEDLLKLWGRTDLVERLKDIVNDEDLSELKNKNR